MRDEQTIQAGRVVRFAYRLVVDGDVMDASEPGEPLVYQHGLGQIVPGLERTLEGRKVGDRVSVTVEAEDGYGPHDPNRIFEFPRDRFPFPLEVGQVLEAQMPDGNRVPLQVVSFDDAKVVLDGNHPLAGKRLQFDVTVEAVDPSAG